MISCRRGCLIINHTYVQYLAIGNKEKILQAPMLYVPRAHPTNREEWKKSELEEYIRKKGMDPKETILFGDHYWNYGAYQVVLPPHYLLKSELNPTNAHGTNSLGIRIVCVSVSDIPPLLGQYKESGLPVAEWDLWKIKDWPQDLRLSTKEGREDMLKKGWLREDVKWS
ncbi:hypothetical protein GYMLUDRAFT_903407 [Collybiopsis luxurians FD-317 M1]|uniref:Uncharacterized protein n=1 Tax=Collybiopsis luxurians FD-317 M1 TaxID=944289 RepID=A0A0D0AUZ9_9AGAR|nr:hypothetical protein GYMLUDRAFT_903407 [Collybiopsis luxurians FD-317 M1]